MGVNPQPPATMLAPTGMLGEPLGEGDAIGGALEHPTTATAARTSKTRPINICYTARPTWVRS
jgi:hypothetical protein